MPDWGHSKGESATRALVLGRGWKRRFLRPSSSTTPSSLVQLFSGLQTALVWLAAFALIVQTTLMLCATSAAAGMVDLTSPDVICHSSGGDSSNNPDGSSNIDTQAKQCSRCPLCAFARGISVPQTPAVAVQLEAAVVVVFGSSTTISPHLHVHDQPHARGPPTTT